MRSGAVFGLAYQSHQMSWFLDYKWINEWLLELFTELAPENDRLKIHPDDLKMDIAAKFHQGHYLNILAILGEEIDIPRIKMISNRSDEINRAIPVSYTHL